MNRRQFSSSLFAALCAVPAIWRVAPAYADDSESSGDESGQGSDGGSDGGSGESQGTQGTDSGGGQGSPSADNSRSNQNDSSSGSDQDRALNAVQNYRAITLDRMIAIFRSEGKGRLLDVALIRRVGKLTYRLKYVDDGGRVGLAYYLAATGKPVK